MSEERKMSAADRVAPYVRAMFRGAGTTTGGALSVTRAVHRKDAIHACEEHAAAAVAEVTKERDELKRYLGKAIDQRDAAIEAESEAVVAREEARERIAGLERERDAMRAELAKLQDVEALLMDAERRIVGLKSAANRGRLYP